MKTVFIDIETIPDSKKCDLALSRITKEYEREGKSVTAEDVNRHMGTIPQWCSIVGLGIAVNNDPVMSYWVGDETSKGERATEVHLLKMFWHIDNPREYWYGIVNRIHFAIDQLNHQQAQGSETLTLNFGDKDYDFEEFLKTELAAIANRLSKDAWGEYSPAMRREILEKGPYIVAQMRDQLCELRQPRLMVVEPVGVNVINL